MAKMIPPDKTHYLIPNSELRIPNSEFKVSLLTSAPTENI